MRILYYVLFIALLPVINPPYAVADSGKHYGGTFTFGFYYKPSIINPILTTQTASAVLVQLIFNGLVRVGSKGEIEPDLAHSWGVSNDGLVYTFYLRKGVKFHDGKECTSHDVKFTYDTIIKPESKSPFRESLQIVDAFEVIDRQTFRVRLKEPSASFIYRMVRYIAPLHLLEGKDLQNNDFNFHPIGTGPFKLRKWSEDNEITLEYNPDYYEGRPYLDKVAVKTYSDAQGAWAALMRGEVDCAEFIEKRDYEIVRNDRTFKAYAVAADYYYALVYNLNDPLLVDKRVREAIAYAVDRKSLIKRAADGYGLESFGPFYPESIGFNPKVLPFEYNPEKAQELLAEAGWQDNDNDGILDKQGEELGLNVLVDSRNNIYEKIIMLLRQQLQEVGIKIKAVLHDDNQKLTPEFISQKKIQAQLTQIFAGMDPNQETDEWSFEERRKDNPLRMYKNEEVDRLFKSGRITKHKEERRKIYQQIHQLIYQDQPACFLYCPFDFHAVSAKFKNTDAYFTVNMPNYKIKDFYLNSAKEPAKERG